MKPFRPIYRQLNARLIRLAVAAAPAALLAAIPLLPLRSQADITFSSPATAPTTQSASGAKNKYQPTGLELQPLPDMPIIDPATGKVQPPATQPLNMLREGQTISDRIGRLSPAPDGPYMQFTLEPLDPSQPGAQMGQKKQLADQPQIAGMTAEPPPPPLPLLVLPNQKLMQMEYALHDTGRDLRFRITGTITEYHDRNFVLIGQVGYPPTDATQPASASGGSSSGSSSGSSAAAAAGGSSATHPLSAEERLDQQLAPLKQQTAAGAGLAPLQDLTGNQLPAQSQDADFNGVSSNSPLAGLALSAAQAANVLREGRTVIDRTGRLTRGADGQTMWFTFDVDRKAMRDPPLIILPNEKLQQMENAVRDSQSDARFRISGVITEFEGRNYILLEKVLVIPVITEQF